MALHEHLQEGLNVCIHQDLAVDGQDGRDALNEPWDIGKVPIDACPVEEIRQTICTDGVADRA